jgi:hypothetical protein
MSSLAGLSRFAQVEPWRRAWARVSILVALAVVAPIQAATPRDEVLRLVPEDVNFCLVIQDLRGHSEALLASPFAKKLTDSPFGKRLLSAPEWQKLAEVNDHLRQHLGTSVADLRDDILGDIVVFAYRPGPADMPQDEQGLMVVRARDEKQLADLLERLNKVQLESGDVSKLQELKYKGKTYYHRVEKKGENYYYLRGPVLAFATKENILRQVIDLDAAAPVPGDPLVARELRRLGADKDLAALWINPRAFEPELQRKADAARGSDAIVLKSLLAYWKAVDGIVFTAALHKDDVEFGFTLGVNENQLLPGGRRFFAGAVKPSRLWSRFPDHALLAVAGQVDVEGLVAMVSEFLPEEARKGIREAVESGAGAALGKDVVKDVLPNLGPDWGFCILAPPLKDRGWFPHMIGALRVDPGKTKPPVDQALLNALNSFAVLAVLGYNKDHPDSPLYLKDTEQGSVPIKYFANDKQFPPGLQPAYALKDGYLVLASSPEAIRRFTSDETAGPMGYEIPLLRLSLRDWRQYLAGYKEALVAYSAERNRISKEEASRRLTNLIEGLEFFDRVELSQRLVRPGQITMVLRIRTMLPLRK